MLVTAYLVVCGGWLALATWRPALWPPATPPSTDHPYRDAALAILAIAGVLLLGQAYRAGYLLPTSGESVGRLAWVVDNLLIYSPIALVLAIRRQSPRTVYLSADALATKVAFGLGLGVLSVLLFLLLRGEPGRVMEILASAFEGKRGANFVPVFLEGVALAFAFVRLRWAMGLWPALVLPAVLFALAHVPGQIQEGRVLAEMAAFFVLNSVLVSLILYVAQRSQDVIWLGIVHYLMDIAIQAI